MECLKEICQNQSAEVIFHSSGSRVCIMNSIWRDEQHPSLINFISNFLNRNSFRLNYVPISPDLIFNCGGLSMAFIFMTSWELVNASPIYNRVMKMKKQFANFYVLVVLSTSEQTDSFIRSYFEMELGRPTFVPVHDVEMGFEMIVKIVHSRGASKQQDAISKLKADKKRSVEVMENFLKVVTSIPGIDYHYAISLGQVLGSIEAIARASMEDIVKNTDLPPDKANIISRFFRDPKFYLSPKILTVHESVECLMQTVKFEDI